MAKIIARNAQVFAGGRDISGRSNSATYSLSAESPESTAFQSVARERLSNGIKDVELSLDGFFDAAASQVDEIMSELLSASAYYGFYPSSACRGHIGREFAGIMSDYEIQEGFADAAAMTATVAGSSLQRRVTALGYISASVNTTSSAISVCTPSVDFGGNSGELDTFYRLVSLTGSAVLFGASLQHSANNTAFTTLYDFGAKAASDAANAWATVIAAGASRYRNVLYNFIAGSGILNAVFLVSAGSEQ